MNPSTRLTIDDLESALEWSSSGGLYENQAFLCRRTGRIYLKSTYREFDEEELPDDYEDGTLYIAVPHRNELDLGRDLVFEFVDAEAPHLAGAVQAAFRRRGAYAQFKSMLERAGMLQRWYDHEAAATRQALRRWAAENDVTLVDAKRGEA